MENFVRVDWEKFRRDLAFPISGGRVDAADADAAYDYLVGLCAILPRFYGAELDRANLWGRIDSALSVVASRCSRSDEIPACCRMTTRSSRMTTGTPMRPTMTRRETP